MTEQIIVLKVEREKNGNVWQTARRWRLEVERNGEVIPCRTYAPSLAEMGNHTVQFYKDALNNLCVRRVKGVQHGMGTTSQAS